MNPTALHRELMGRTARLHCATEDVVQPHIYTEIGPKFPLEELLPGARDTFRLSDPPRWGRGLLFRCEGCGAIRR